MLSDKNTRRQFLQASLMGLGGAAVLPSLGHAATLAGVTSQRPDPRQFQLKYAPHFGMFKEHAGADLVDQLQFMHDEGFVALEDNGMASRTPETQLRLASAMERLGIEMGVFVAHTSWGKVSFAGKSDAIREQIKSDMTKAVEVKKRGERHLVHCGPWHPMTWACRASTKPRT